ncbi:MAG: tail protein X [Bacillota bacterium]
MNGQPIIVVAGDREPVDALLWRSVGERAGAVERVLDANPGLGDLGAFLPAGTEVLIPAEALVPPQAPLIQLWS